MRDYKRTFYTSTYKVQNLNYNTMTKKKLKIKTSKIKHTPETSLKTNLERLKEKIQLNNFTETLQQKILEYKSLNTKDLLILVINRIRHNRTTLITIILFIAVLLTRILIKSQSISVGLKSDVDDSFEETSIEFVPKHRIVPITIKTGATTSMIITEDRNFHITNTTKNLLIFISSDTIHAQNWTQYKNFYKLVTDIHFYPLFIDMPGIGDAKEFSKPDELGGIRGWNIFVHSFFKSLDHIYGNFDYYFVGLDNAGEFLTPLMVEMQSITAKDDRHVSATHLDLFGRTKMFFVNHELTGLQKLQPLKLSRFHVPHFWVIFNLVKGSSKTISDELLKKNVRKMRYIHETYIWRDPDTGEFVKHLDHFTPKLIDWLENLSKDESFIPQEFIKGLFNAPKMNKKDKEREELARLNERKYERYIKRMHGSVNDTVEEMLQEEVAFEHLKAEYLANKAAQVVAENKVDENEHVESQEVSKENENVESKKSVIVGKETEDIESEETTTEEK